MIPQSQTSTPSNTYQVLVIITSCNDDPLSVPFFRSTCPWILILYEDRVTFLKWL